MPYTQIRPDGAKEFPQGIPFGGRQAPECRVQLMEMLLADLALLPQGIGAHLWNERSSPSMRFHRVDPSSYGALLNESVAAGRLHAASLILPCDFDDPFEMTSPLERRVGSTAAIEEIQRGPWSEETLHARETLLAALQDAVTPSLPMIVDG